MTSFPSPQPFETMLSAAQAGNSDAINSLFSTFYPRVSQIVHRNLAEDLKQGRGWLMARFSTGDVVQEVFWSVLRDLEGFAGKTEGAFIGYLAMVVRNRIIDALRYHQAEKRDGRRSTPVLSEGTHPSGEALPVDLAIIAENSQRCDAALKTLTERERLLLRARFEESASFEELTEQLGYSHESSARRAYYQAIAKLSLILNPETSEGDA